MVKRMNLVSAFALVALFVPYLSAADATSSVTAVRPDSKVVFDVPVTGDASGNFTSTVVVSSGVLSAPVDLGNGYTKIVGHLWQISTASPKIKNGNSR